MSPVPFAQRYVSESFHVVAWAAAAAAAAKSLQSCLTLYDPRVYSFLLLSTNLLCEFAVQSLSHVQFFATPWTAEHQASLSFVISWSLLRLTSIESVMLCHPLILCHPLLLLPTIFLSIRVFSNESVLRIMWPKYWNFSFGISPSSEYSGLIPFRIDWLIYLKSKGLSRVFSNTTARKHQFFGAQPLLWSNSHQYVTTGKAITDYTDLCWQSTVSAF